jgi:hypothetical protein
VSDWGVMPFPIDYGTYVGMLLSGPRKRMRDVYYDGLAHSLAAGVGDVPAEVVAAACDSPEAATALAFEINAARDRTAKGF